jgi:predicted nucleotidyltransferase
MNERSVEHYLAVLRQHEVELRARGIAGAAIFGSAARGGATDESDIDVLIDLDPNHQMGFEYFSLPEYFEQILGVRTDLVSLGAIKPEIRERALRDAVRAF